MAKTNRRVPFVEQMQQTECGLCCAAMILRYYKSYESLSSLRSIMEVGRDGLSLSKVKRLLELKGFSSAAYRTSIEGLLQINTPSILHWDDNHFVVLDKVKKNHFLIVDPAVGRKKISYAELEKHFTGIVLIPVPNEDFIPHKHKDNPFKFLLPHIRNNKGLFSIIFALSLLTYISTLLMPISIQILTDTVIQENIISWHVLMLFIGALCLNFVATYSRGRYLINVKSILEKDLQSNVFKHILNIPYKFFELRAKGDILYRLNSMDIIKDLLADKIIRGVLDIGALIFIFSYMLYKSTVLAVVVFGLFSIYLIITVLLRNYLKELNLYEIVERSKMQKIQVETISSILGIKVSASEGEILYQWNKKLEDVIERFKNQGYVSNIYTTFNQISVIVSPIIVLFISMNLYINNTTSIGETIAFYTITTMFFSYSSSFFQVWNSFWIASNTIERLKDITDVPEENINQIKDKVSLKGSIELKNVSFSYTSNNDDLVLLDLSLKIKSGQKIAIVGESGSGKSTLAKLLIGLYEPTHGTIYYDGIPMSNINKKHLRKQMAIVPQEIQLMNKSIYDNISMGNLNAPFEEVRKAAEIAQISESIEALPMKYNTLVSDMGSNFSGGQRQRIALARSIINKHRIVVLDEATSSLDSLNEVKIANYFKEIGSTSIVIAHRLSTIIDCDMIFVMEAGKIRERGTHEELISLKGKYNDLYSSSKIENEKIQLINN
ncbi:peptidase C39 [Rossellomorea marisflavi]|uniref:peptidase domain-containing ABC transporter n=1 Tax=Rossellomorea marisflavi TaxID=189381 RepID=UPI0025C79648|nr:peptidase domain-containing ABC transporter [Rossellomorea marisflavi]GLI84784.1 peptidase C39 [Rossellomorea marisflavi]